MPTAEVADRLTINLLKLARQPDNPVLLSAVKAYLAEVMRTGVSADDFVELFAANARVWELESAIRQGKEQQLGMEEIGRRALLIREHNTERCAAKDRIAAAACEAPDIKLEHLSVIPKEDISLFRQGG